MKFHLSGRLQSGGPVAEAPRKPLPPAPHYTSPGLWLKTRVLPHFYLANGEVRQGYYTGTDNRGELENTK